MIALENMMDLAVKYIDEGYGAAVALIEGGCIDVYCLGGSGKPVWNVSGYAGRAYDRCGVCIQEGALHFFLSGGEFQPMHVRIPGDRILSVAPCFAHQPDGWGKK